MKNAQYLIQLGILLAILVVINFIAQQVYTYIDLTEDKRYTLSEPTQKLLSELDDNYFVAIYLDGTFPASIKRYRDRVEQVIKEFQNESSNISYEFTDPIGGTPEENKLMEKNLVDKRLYPTTINYFDGEENIMKPIFPYAVVRYFNKEVVVNLLDIEGVTNYDDETLHIAEGLLEYKLANAFQKIQLQERPIIAFTDGNGEVPTIQLGALQNELKRYYNPIRINLDSVYTMTDVIDLLIVAGPKEEISGRNQFMLDQYIMNGGKVIWLVESVDIRVDSIAFSTGYIPPTVNHGLDGLFFKYGFKVLNNTILDLESSSIAQVVGSAGGKTQMDMFKYVYHPLIQSDSKHPIAKNIDRVNMFFPSTIDTVVTKPGIRKEFLLRSSPYSRYQLVPFELNFRMLGIKPQVSKYNKGGQPVALLLEGRFESAFKNRLTQAQEEALAKVGTTFLDESPETKMLVISDVEFMENLYNPNNGNISPIGFNKWERKIYKGNKELILNAIEYLLDENGILASRAKEYKLRLLDEVQTTENKFYWQSLNIAFPLTVLALFGLLFYVLRKRRYAKKR